MPLSEEEQRILHEIERSYYDHDPAFTRADASEDATVTRKIRLAAAGFVLSLIALLVGFASSFVIGALAFLGMVATGAVLIDNARRLGSARLRASAGKINAVFGDPRRRLGDRMRRPDEE
ncbi:MAG TPA: DUF3040 domain-containing protein [Acidimicrobiales bacterium]|nr:DUF3040 domain-containing protein [Acidimicrobiales bacterium]